MHLDGYNLLPYLTGKEAESPRKGFIYFTDDGDVAALRYDNWKIVFMEQRCPARSRSGWNRSSCCACRTSSICGWTRTSARHHLEHLL